MSYNGSGTFQINTSGQPVVAGTVISATAFNALTADLATGLSTAITKDGQTTTTARIPFAAGISSTLTTDSSSVSTGSIITSGGVGIAKNLYVGANVNVAGTLGVTGVATFSAAPIYSSLTASSAVATDASKGLVSVTNTGTGNNVLATSPTLVTPVLGAASATSVTVAAGTVSDPAITITGDTNTGIFFPAADTIAFSEGGVESMRIDSSGNVGIGTSSPASRLNILAASAESFRISYDATKSARFGATSAGDLQVYAFDGSNYRNILLAVDGATSVGNVGIGTSSPEEKLHIKSSVAGVYLKMQDSTGTAFVGCNASALQFFAGTTERARITSSGDLLVAKTSSSTTTAGAEIRSADGSFYSTIAATTNATSTYNAYSTGAGAYRFYVGMAGTVFATNTTITAISDQRLKENIRDLDDGLQKIMALQPRKFDWKEGKGADIKDARGFIAQEFEIVFPDMVEEWKDPAPEGEEPYKAVNANLIPTLVKAIQEQQALITTLTDRITALEAK
jgi:hypothetical protein